MSGLNRFLVVFFALAWLAALGVVLWLVWDQGRIIEVNDGGIEVLFDVTLERAEQILASIILGALALPPLAMLLMQLKRSRPRRIEQPVADDRIAQLQGQVDALERRLRESPSEPARPAVVSTDERHDEPAREPRSRRWHLPTPSRR